MFLSMFAIVSDRGEVLLMESYRNNIAYEELINAVSVVTKTKYDHCSPFIRLNGLHGYYIKREKVIYLVLSNQELCDIVVVGFLDSFYGLVKNFCGGASEDFIRRNSVLIYELMTECVDNGIIKTTNADQLRPVVYSDPAVLKLNENYEVKKHGPFGIEKVFAQNTASKRPLVKSRSQQNVKDAEVFVDVVERLTTHFSKDGVVDRFFLHGAILVKSFIRLNHFVTIHLEDKKLDKSRQGDGSESSFDKCSFDDCVDVKDFEKSQSFIIHPSQEEITAMTYHIESFIPVNLPFRLTSNLENSQVNKDCDLSLKLSCNIPGSAEVLNLMIHIPISSDTKHIMQQFSEYENSAEFIKKERKIVWKIKKLPGVSEVIAKFKLVDAIQHPANHLEMGPVALEFEASNYTCSGLLIKNLKAEDPAKQAIPIKKWVRYATVADSYMFKLIAFNKEKGTI